MSINVNLQDVLSAAQQLDGIGDKYSGVITNLGSIAGLGDAFETGEVSGPWSNMVNTYWGYCADSSDNCHKTSRTLIRYINATCAQDADAAKELARQVDDYNEAQRNTNKDSREYVPPLPKPDLTDPGNVIDEEPFDESDRPPGGK